MGAFDRMSTPVPRELQAVFSTLLEACRLWLGSRQEDVDLSGVAMGGLRRLSHFHGLDPLLHRLLETECLDGADLPPALTTIWRETYDRNLAYNRELLETLVALLAAGNETGDAPFAVFKGPVTAVRVWGDLGLRVMRDLDILCREEDLPHLIDAAARLGYSPADENAIYHLSMLHVGTSALVELHFNLYDFLPQRRRLLEEIIETMESVQIEGVAVPAPRLEEALLLDVAHMVNHNFEVSLKSLLDVAASIVQTPLDVARLRKVGVRFGLAPELDLVAEAVKRLFDVETNGLPAAPLSRSHRHSLEQILDGLTRVDRQAPRPALREMAYRRGLLERYRYLRRLVFPPLAHLQAASGRGSRWGGLVALPAHLARLFGRGWRNLRQGGFRSSGQQVVDLKAEVMARQRRAD